MYSDEYANAPHTAGGLLGGVPMHNPRRDVAAASNPSPVLRHHAPLRTASELEVGAADAGAAASPVDLALRRQREDISDLLGIVDALATRLSVVLGPEHGGPEGPQTLEKEPISPLVGIIGVHTGQVRHASRTLANLLDRLTI